MRAEPPLARVLARALQPPVRDRRFWLVQALVVLIGALHAGMDLGAPLASLGIPHFATVALFLIPITYAALNFGLTGSVATAAWITLVTLPDLVRFDSGADRVADGIQLVVVDAVAIFVGQRVERERLAREAHGRAERRYRALFETNLAPILLADKAGRVREANPAAARIFGPRTTSSTLAELLGPAAGAVLAGGDSPATVEVNSAFGPLTLRARSTAVPVHDHQLLQVVLEDFTEERREQQRIKAYAAQVLEAQEEERRRIAHELHDEPLQAMLQLVRRLDALRETQPAPAATVREIDAALELSSVIARDLRRMAQGLRPPSLDDLGLLPALRQLVDQLKAREHIRAQLRVSGDLDQGRLAPAVELGVFRIVQEALHNVERHAAAGRVTVALELRAHAVTVKVQDDGAGFEVENALGGRSLGLLGMRERAGLLGGDLKVDSRPGTGTTVTLWVPHDGGFFMTGPEAARAGRD